LVLLDYPSCPKIKQSHCRFDEGREEKEKKENLGFRSSVIFSRKWPRQKHC
jgi:hypothetical protein